MAVAWAALGVLTAFSLGVLALMVSLLSRFDALNARIDRSDAEHREEIRALGTRVDALGDRIDRHIRQP
jgi:hypothetical protein